MIWLVVGAVVALVVGVSIAVQVEAAPLHESLGGAGPERALVLFHPSRDARFSDDLSSALADGFMDAGMAVDRATVTGQTPTRPEGYAIIGVVSNTYWWTPDLPTRRFLARAQLDGMPVVGLIGGAGATGRSERVLRDVLGRTGARVLDVRSFWLWRPNDEGRLDEPNREVALDLAKRLGRDVARRLTERGPGRDREP